MIGFLLLNAGGLVFPCTFIITDIVAEVFGYEVSKQLIYSGIIATTLFILTVELANAAPFPAYWKNQNAYNAIFGKTLIIDLICACSTVVGLFINIYNFKMENYSSRKNILASKHWFFNFRRNNPDGHYWYCVFYVY